MAETSVIKGYTVLANGAGISNVCSATVTKTANTVDSTTFGNLVGHSEVVMYYTCEMTLEGYCQAMVTGESVDFTFGSTTGTGLVTSCSQSGDPGSLLKTSATIRWFEAASSGGSNAPSPDRAPAQS